MSSIDWYKILGYIIYPLDCTGGGKGYVSPCTIEIFVEFFFEFVKILSKSISFFDEFFLNITDSFSYWSISSLNIKSFRQKFFEHFSQMNVFVYIYCMKNIFSFAMSWIIVKWEEKKFDFIWTCVISMIRWMNQCQ
jgi:hypothetical protein